MQNYNNSWFATLTLDKEGENNSSQYSLSAQETNIIGRSPECKIVLDPQKYITVSRHHAQVKLSSCESEISWEISDLGTINGTLVNEQKIDGSYRLKSGDRITLGLKGPEFIFECQTLNATVLVEIPKDEEDTSIATTVAPLELSCLDNLVQPLVINTSETAPSPSIEKEELVKSIQTSEESEESSTVKISIIEVLEPKLHEDNNSASSQSPTTEVSIVATSEVSSIKQTTVEVKSDLNLDDCNNSSQNKIVAELELATKTSVSEEKLTVITKSSSSRTLWNLIDWTDICELPNSSQDVQSLVFSPDGQTLASAGADKTIKLWNLSDQREIATFSAHKLAVNTLAFSPDGQTLASAGADKTIKLWNLSDQREIATFSAHKLAVNTLAFSPDGQTLASAGADKTIKLWNLSDQREIATFSAHKLAVNTLAFSPDGQTLASAGADKTIKLWNLSNQREIATFSAHKLAVNTLAFSPDGQTLAGSCENAKIKIWKL
jgi:WD40 repeat protein